ncbi:T6SS immunity protein Tdi1 domain-containing protein [Yimella sp. cx-51]|uniref:T6SS immunity protein Tdi1 domain-containing protein n=1 Tax=Yimella sp. cx-51 TaxID=2770551 RepID=UPI00165EAC70|nr:T6SS immunity protein Tdi1 domain-containing protein [Yimella sp. cx-51]MBC9956751.1 DUF1851 domain-containing protein [Yimella sp. cx-51]QTH38987.1 DUF1851 domain-containing protein [Yimella sp. cx-51]
MEWLVLIQHKEQQMPVFDTFHTIAPMPSNVIEEYADRVGDEIVAMWREHGVGFVDDGFLRVVDPQWFEEKQFVHLRSGVPIFLTALCDTIMFIPETASFTAMKLRWSAMDIVSESGQPVAEALCAFGDPAYRERVLESRHFTEAAARLGVPDFDEGFMYTPMLALGGPHSSSTLRRGKAVVSQSLLLQAEPPQLRHYSPARIEPRADY